MRINRIAMVLLFLMGIYILAASGTVLCANLVEMAPDQVLETMKDCLVKEAAANIYPGMFIPEEKEQEGTFSKWYAEMVLRMHPLMRLQAGIRENGGSENLATYEMLIQGGVHDENELDESGQEYDLASLAEQENAAASRQSAEETEQTVQEPTIQEPKEDRLVSEEQSASHMGTIYNLEELSDYEYLLSHFYTVEPTTAVTAQELDAEKLLAEDMTIDRTVDGPQILIYHTHSQEGFADSVPGDPSTTIVGAGEYLAELLRNRGYKVMHVTSVYDLIDGELDRSEAYSRAEEEISQILAEHPSIQSVIDLHRDGVAEGTRLVTELNGKTMARFMFFNGLSRTRKNGPIEYLHNPYIEDNLALTLQLKLTCDQYYPGLARNIYLKSLRYNLHLSPKALLIEAGAQTNTLQEILNTMEPLADVLDTVFGG
ncbi:stage II sporulation protein P [Clostridiaceae bacterium Marseille-Q4143]|nr:stage II sporulation protein P [Clostridiaceae bacterium]QUO22337.1 stage II sporulation protein P [Clostridiaceae bacterium Marseille-Q4143]